MASFRKRGELQWQARIARKGFPAQVKTFDTRAEAEAWARQIESEIDKGIFVSRTEAESTTLKEALARYQREIAATKKGAASEGSVIRIWLGTELASRSLASIRSADVAKLRDEWLQSRKPATVLRRFAILSHMFNVARKEWRMESLVNPVELIRKPQPNNARTRRLAKIDNPEAGRSPTRDELEWVIATSCSAVLPSIVMLAVETAMRRGEIADLRWEHVNLQRRTLHLPDTKNGASRDVPLSSKAVAIFENILGDTALSAQRGKVFDIRSDAITRAFERAVIRARKNYVESCLKNDQPADEKYLLNLRFHDLRHEATSRLAEIFAIHELSKITGHKDPRMLMRYYHPRAEDLAKRLA